MIGVIPIFSDRSISKNASIVLATPLPTFRLGPPSTEFYADISASGGGNIAMFYQTGNTPSGDFIQPGCASNIGVQKSTLGNGASRDFHPAFSPVLSRWVKFKAKELNASPVTLNFNLIVAK